MTQFQLTVDIHASDDTFLDAAILLDFRRLVKSFVASFGGPILVHSARDLVASGLFLAVDALLDFVVATQKVFIITFIVLVLICLKRQQH